VSGVNKLIMLFLPKDFLFEHICFNILFLLNPNQGDPSKIIKVCTITFMMLRKFSRWTAECAGLPYFALRMILSMNSISILQLGAVLHIKNLFGIVNRLAPNVLQLSEGRDFYHKS